jgi:hypothetical protein
MRCLTELECRDRLALLGVALIPPYGLTVYGNQLVSRTFEIPDSCRLQAQVIKKLFHLYGDDRRWLLWLRDWGIWHSEEYPEVWQEIREGHGEERPIIDAPGHLFEPHEKPLAEGMARLTMLFGWDAFLFSEPLSHCVFMSNDNALDVFAGSLDALEELSREVGRFFPLLSAASG